MMLDSLFDPLIEKAIELLSPSRIYLFGSFARGDAKSHSDIDLAFDFPRNHRSWAQFTHWVEEEFQSLRQLDLVDWQSASKELQDTILKEGKLLYERKN